MKLERSKAWWMRKAALEGDHVVGAGVPDRVGRVFRIGAATLHMVDDDARSDEQVVRDFVEAVGGVFDERIDWERVSP